jgi:hypothetical protein
LKQEIQMTQDASFPAAEGQSAGAAPIPTNIPHSQPADRQPAGNSRSILETLLQKPALATGESLEDFGKLVAEATAAVQPKTFFERLEVNDLCHTVWEEQRFRRQQAALPNATRFKALQCLLAAIGLEQRALEIATDYFGVDEEERKKAITLVQRYGITDDAITAQASELHLATLSVLERLATNRQSQRNMIVKRCHRRQRQADKRPSRQPDQLNGTAAVTH